MNKRNTIGKNKVLLEKKNEILGVAQPRKFNLDPSCYCLATQVEYKTSGSNRLWLH
jgi:hypothetical protein